MKLIIVTSVAKGSFPSHTRGGKARVVTSRR